MKKLLPFLFLVILFSCIDKIEFPTGEVENLVVVDGIFSASEGEKTIKLSRTLEVNSQVNIPVEGARVFVEDEQGQRISFPELEPGAYTSSERADSNLRYKLYAELPDGRNISSNFQSVPDSFSIDNITTIDTMTFFLNESGSTQRLRALEFFAQAKNASVENDLFLRFSYETVFQVLETQCSPFHTVKRCYVKNDERAFDVNLFEIDRNVTEAEFETLVLRRKIDYRLAEVFALDLSLLSYNEEEFNYWSDLKDLFDQKGNIDDVNPARLVGNIKADDGTEVLGQFAVVGQSRKIKIVGNADFPTQRLPFCGLAGQRPWPLPDECCECLLHKGASTNKPSYWPG